MADNIRVCQPECQYQWSTSYRVEIRGCQWRLGDGFTITIKHDMSNDLEIDEKIGYYLRLRLAPTWFMLRFFRFFSLKRCISFHCDILCFTYAFSCCGMFYFQFGYASYCLRSNESSHESLEWLILWLTGQVIGSRYESLVAIWTAFTWYKRVVSWLYSLVKLYTTKLLLHSLILKVT